MMSHHVRKPFPASQTFLTHSSPPLLFISIDNNLVPSIIEFLGFPYRRNRSFLPIHQSIGPSTRPTLVLPVLFYWSKIPSTQMDTKNPETHQIPLLGFIIALKNESGNQTQAKNRFPLQVSALKVLWPGLLLGSVVAN